MDDLISRQAAIEDLRTCQTYLFDTRDKDKKISLEDAEYVIEQLPSVQQWIPVSERLPDEDLLTGTGKQYSADVLMTVFNTIDDETIIDYGHTIDGEWYSDTTDCYIPHGWKVIAWCEQPEPYKGEQE